MLKSLLAPRFVVPAALLVASGTLVSRVVAEKVANRIKPVQVVAVQNSEKPARPAVVCSVAVMPGGKLIATAGDDHLVRLWSTDGKQLVELKGHRDWVRSVVFSPDGATLATTGDDRRIILWDVAGMRQRLLLPKHEQSIYALAYSPDGKLLAAVGFERKVRIYNTDTNELIHVFEGPCNDLRTVAFSPDGAHVATAGRNGQIYVYEVESELLSLEIAADVDRIRAVAFSPDGTKLVSAGEGKAICLWDAHTGETIHKIPSRPAKVQSLVYGSDDLIVTGGSDNTIRVWDLTLMTEAFQFVGHTGSVAALNYDPQSALLVSGSFDTTMRVWKFNTAENAGTARRQPGVPGLR